jgi:predicted signal transduction protein with EAL and GGDEF domain
VITLSSKWVSELASKPETGMGYQVVSVILQDGRRFDQTAVVEGVISEIRGLDEIPFTEDQIAQIILTHDKWDFNAARAGSPKAAG